MYYYGNNDYRDYLAHYGVLGMHWGIRRYQPYSYTDGRDGFRKGKEIGAAKKISGAIKTAGSAVGRAIRITGKNASSSIKAYRANRKIRRAERKAERAEKKKQEIINSGDIDKVMKHRSKLSTDEIKQATDRIMAESRLRDLESEEAMKSIERGRRLIANVADMTRNVSSIYNVVTDVKKKMDDSAADKERKAKEKEMERIVGTADKNVIDKAIREGKLTSEFIKKGRENVQNRELILNKGNSIEEMKQKEADDLAAKYQQRAQQQYDRNVTNNVDSNTRKIYEDVDRRVRLGKDSNMLDDMKIEKDASKSKSEQTTNTPSKGTNGPKVLKFNNHSKDYERDPKKWDKWTKEAVEAREKKEAAEAKVAKRSESAKKGWMTRRTRHAESLKSARTAELNSMISNWQKARTDEAIASYIARDNEKKLRSRSATEAEKDAIGATYRARRDAEAAKQTSGYEYFKSEREKKDTSILNQKLQDKRIQDSQDRGRSVAEEELEKLRKRGHMI